MLKPVVSPARQVAAEVLFRVANDDAWAAPTLDAALRDKNLQTRDRNLATAIVYGTLRSQRALDAALEAHFSKKRRTDRWVQTILQMSAFQILHLRSTAPHAVVDDAVTLVRRRKGARVAGFCNAVLRKVAQARPEQPTLPSHMMVPPWLHSGLEASLGDEATRALLKIPETGPSIHLHVLNKERRASVANAIARAHPEASVELSAAIPTCIAVSRVGDPRALVSFEEGAFFVQDEGSQWVVQCVDAQPGMHVLDVCAGRGGKTVAIAHRLGAQGRLVATDVHAHKLSQIVDHLSRLKIATPVETVALDASVNLCRIKGDFDRVLVDAPCTGAGTVRRRPEIVSRLKSEDMSRMADLQRRLVVSAAQLVRPGGILVYAVCSPLAEEGEAHRTLELPGMRLLDQDEISEKTGDLGKNGVLRWGSWHPQASPFADAYQVLRWVNVG